MPYLRRVRRTGQGGLANLLEMQLINALTNAHARAVPWTVAGCLTIGPTPPALTMNHTKNAIPAIGATTALTVKKWRMEWNGKYMGTRDAKLNRKNARKCPVSVPEAGIPLWRRAIDGQMDWRRR